MAKDLSEYTVWQRFYGMFIFLVIIATLIVGALGMIVEFEQHHWRNGGLLMPGEITLFSYLIAMATGKD